MAVGYAPSTIDEVLAFHIHGEVVGLLAALVVYHVYGVRLLAPRLAPHGEPAVTSRQRFCYFAGVVLLGAVTSWPIHDIGDGSLFTFHMIEHMVIAFVAPPLLIAGTPWWLLRATVRPVMGVLRVLTKPLVALFLFNVTLAALHWTVAVELMLTNGFFHFGAHLVLLVTAILMWWPVLGPIPDLPRLSPFPRIGYLFLQSLVPTVPASFLTLASGVVYHVYEGTPRLFGWSLQTDQTIAGLVMKLGGSAVLWTAIAWTFFAWFAEEEKTAVPGTARAPR